MYATSSGWLWRKTSIRPRSELSIEGSESGVFFLFGFDVSRLDGISLKSPVIMWCPPGYDSMIEVILEMI